MYLMRLAQIKEIEKGVKIELILNEDRNNICTITLSLEMADVDRNKIRHSFPMPRILLTTHFIKLPVRDFSDKSFIITAQSLKGKIRDKSVSVFPSQSID
jgi:hypothetical protein